MTRDEFTQIADKIEATYQPKCPEGFTDLQFEEWWDSFSGEDYVIATRALKVMKDGGHGMNAYAYFPTPSTFWAYINKIKEIDENKQKAEQKPKEFVRTKEDRDRHKRWMRFIFWTLETGKFPKTSEEAFMVKAKFEKEHPNWQRQKKVSTDKPETISQILK